LIFTAILYVVINMSLIDLLAQHKTISLIGMTKNAGKTTVLNYLIEEYAKNSIRLGLTSIGRDGEDVDVVTFTPKPKIFVQAGTILATAEGLLKFCDISAKTLSETEFSTPLGQVVIVRAMSAGFVQLGGPSMVAQMAQLLPLLQGFGADKVIVDGAISRKSPASPQIADAVVLCTGAALSQNINEVIIQTRHVANILLLQTSPCSHFHINGALTDRFLLKLITSSENLRDKVIVANDASKILISKETHEKLRTKGGSLAVKHPINLVAICINPTSPKEAGFDAKQFLQQMRTAITDIPIFDVKNIDSIDSFVHP